jgi:hypothetical protein
MYLLLVPITAQRVEEVLSARFWTIPETTGSLRQGRAALARPAQNPLAEHRSEFINKLRRSRNRPTRFPS